MSNTDLPPVDNSVSLPPAVKAAAEAADRAHQQAYGTPEPAPAPTPAPAAPQAAAAPAPAPQPTPEPPRPASAEQVDWESRYNSMKGRFDQAQRTIGSMQTQMSEAGNEIGHLHQLLQGQPRQQQTKSLLTEADKERFGDELLDVMQRAAKVAVAPDLANIAQATQNVHREVVTTSRHQTLANLDTLVPQWREINVSDRFKQWASSPDIYSGMLRGRLLNAAIQNGDAARAAAFFQGFLNEELATGHLPAQQVPQQPAPAPAQAPALTLESLAAPGRAKPAPGETPGVPAEKPIITRSQISAFYSNVRKGVYSGRDADKNALEAEIFAAQREGRVRG